MKMQCDYCGKVTEHRYTCTKEFPNATLEMYDCVKCKSTHTVKVGNGTNGGNSGNSSSGNGGYQEWTSGWN